MPRLESRYLKIVALSAALLLTAGISFNVLVDPYGMHRIYELTGYNTHKPAIYRRVRLLKAYDLRRIRPRAIVLGTSRSHVGLRMSHPGWNPSAVPRYNCAFDGATTKEMYFYLRHAYAMRPLTQVVLGLDTYHPTDAPATTRPDFNAALLTETGSTISSAQLVLEDVKLLTSFDTFRASVTTLQSQHAGQEWFAPDGQRLGEVFFRDLEAGFQKCPRSYFEAIDQQEVGFKLEGRNQDAKRVKLASTGSTGKEQTSLWYIGQIIQFCRDKDIDLRVFITPEHAHQEEIAAAVGSGSSVDQAKRALVGLLAEDAARHVGQQPFPLYDFSGYNSITTESLPTSGSSTEMKYYWDSSHFKQQVGDFVLDRLFGVSHPENLVPADFGIRLTQATIDSSLAHAREDQIAYRTSHPEEVATIRSYVQNAMRTAQR